MSEASKIKEYQGNIIKSVYYRDISNNDHVTKEDMYDYYTNDIISGNAVEVPDKIATQSLTHAFTHKYLTEMTSSMHSYARFTTDEIKPYEHNYKLMDSRDVDWDSAYLRYAYKDSVMNKSFDYNKLSIDTTNNESPELKRVKTLNDSYIYNHEVYNDINNTYELLSNLDYLCQKMQALYFQINIIKEQRDVIAAFEAL